MVLAAAPAPSAHGEDTTTSASRSRSASWVTGESIVDPQSMIEMLGTLENKGLVQRAPAPDHGRIMHVELTAKGRRVLGQCDAEIDRLEAKMTGELSPAQLAAFERTLRSCVHMLGAGLPDA